LTLVECLIALTILPLAVVAVSYAVTSGQMQSVESLRSVRAAALTDALLEEILSKSYSEPGGGNPPLGKDTGETTRPTFDDMDDYHNYTEAAGALRDATQTLYAGEYQRFSRAVACTSATAALSGLGPAVQGLYVTVTVGEAGATLVTVTRFVPRPS
jgi:Tfp pilus assembly protein PilV